MIRVLVVDDSAFMRRLLADVLESTGELKVVGIARHGQDAVEKNLRLRPDVITLDVEMPVMDGLSALTEIMHTRPAPVVMLSSLTTTGAQVTLESLARGAVDFISKPDNPQEVLSAELRRAIVDKVLLAAGVDLRKLTVEPAIVPLRRSPDSDRERAMALVGVGTSTGGPRALQQLFTQLPRGTGAAFLVVQHMPKSFTRSLAERLDGLSELTVTEAVDGELLEVDHVYIAPGDSHLTVVEKGGNPSVQLLRTPVVNGHRPAVDTLFSSMAELAHRKRVGVILTGMGADGARGVELLKHSGAYILAEDQSSAVIYGMPRAAVVTGCVDRSVALQSMSQAVLAGLEG